MASLEFSTWRSLKTTRPHWFCGMAPRGVLKVRCCGMPALGLSMYIQRWVGALTLLKSRRSVLMLIWPSVDEAPTSLSQLARRLPFANVVSM